MEERLRERHARLEAYDASEGRQELGRRIARRFFGAADDAEVGVGAPAD